MSPVDIGNAAQVVSAATGICSFIAVVWISTSQRSAVNKASAAAADAKNAALEMANAARWHDTETGKAVVAKVDRSAVRLDLVEERLIHVATKEDVARLSGQIDVVTRASSHAVAGIDRIESYFLAEGVKRS